MDNNALMHHGILGQKWGVRRYQNKDGTLTEAGKRRAQQGSNHSSMGKTDQQKLSETQKRYDAKNRGTLTNAQLQAKIERLQMEKRLHELTNSEINSGRAFAEQILRSVGNRVVTTALTGAVLYGGKALVTRSFDVKELGEAIFNGGPKKKK